MCSLPALLQVVRFPAGKKAFPAPYNSEVIVPLSDILQKLRSLSSFYRFEPALYTQYASRSACYS